MVGKPAGVDVVVVHVKVPALVEVNICPSVPAAVNPVPPFAIATAVPLHTPVVIVPALVKFEPVMVDFGHSQIHDEDFDEELDEEEVKKLNYKTEEEYED